MKSQIKKITSLFLCVCVALSVMAVASFASTESKTYTFSDYKESGAQTNYSKVLDSDLTVGVHGETSSGSGYFHDQLRVYGGANAVFTFSKAVSSITMNLGYKNGVIDVFTSTDGSTWTEVESDVAYTTAYSDKTFTFATATKYVKIAPSLQLRIKTLTATFAAAGGDSSSSSSEESSSSETSSNTSSEVSSDVTSSATSSDVTSSGTTSTPAEKTFAEAYTEAQALAHNEKLSYSVTATGKITAVNNAYSEQYSNITVTIDVDGTSIKCYRAKGDSNNTETVKTLAVGDTITITGQLAKFYENVQFPAGSLISAVV
ncbi:MAG: hypothetical protein IJ027_03890, partial [Oscillospiraceae bacterium]|nr:hypothetical protein [Oscillospiraceae bacterium]